MWAQYLHTNRCKNKNKNKNRAQSNPISLISYYVVVRKFSQNLIVFLGVPTTITSKIYEKISSNIFYFEP